MKPERSKLFAFHKKVFFFSLFVIFLSCISYASETLPILSENAGKFLTYEKACTWLKKLSDNNEHLIQVERIGITRGRQLPIYLAKIDDTSFSQKDKLRIMIIARVHGNEPAGMEAALQLIYDLCEKNSKKFESYLHNISFYIVPCLNPEGTKNAQDHYDSTNGFWDRTGRYNGSGIDINRDFHALRSVEAAAVVNLFNKVKPHVIIDLHEYSSIPLIVDDSGWWRAKYFDFMIGAGRNPDVYPPLAELARNITETSIFPTMRASGFNGEYYAVPSGSFDSTYYNGTNAADYFNLRNSLTFLVETGGYDQGLSAIKKRRWEQNLALESILDRIVADREKIIRLASESCSYSARRREITLRMKPKPRNVNLGGKNSDTFKLSDQVNLNNKVYHSNITVKFTEGDTQNRNSVKLPSYYVLLASNTDFIEKLLTHGAKIYFSADPAGVAGIGAPAYSFIIPVNQESSAIIGLLLDEKALQVTDLPAFERFVVFKREGELDTSILKQIRTLDDAAVVISRFAETIK